MRWPIPANSSSRSASPRNVRPAARELNRELVTLQRDAKRLARVDGLGHLPSGTALARKFEQKASGGEYPLDQALADHITVVEEMQSVFEKIAANYATAEESNAQRFTESGG